MESELEKQCFVCFGSEPPLFRVCKCNTFVHLSCQRQILRVPSHSNARCAVCRAAYVNAEPYLGVAVRHLECAACLVSGCTLTALALVIVLLLWNFVFYQSVAALVGASFVVALYGLVLLACWKSRRMVRCPLRVRLKYRVTRRNIRS